MLSVGDRAPDFEAAATTGRRIRLSDLVGRRVVLYFFPKAFTPGCTLETKLFRESYDELATLGVEVIGISTDDFDTQCSFAREHGASFPMIADHDRRIARAYGVLWPILPFARRVTFVVGPDGVIEGAYGHEVRIARHIEDVKEHLRHL